MQFFRMTFYGMIALGVLSCGVLFAGEIKGKVVDASTQKSLGGVNIFLLPERVRAATSDEQGNYRIQALSAGAYQLMASSIGYNIQIKAVEVGDVGAITQDFEIILSAFDVETPIVAASKREQTLIEAPTSVAVLFPQEVAEADEATTLAEVLKNVPGLDYAKGFEGHYNITARGFNNYLNNSMLLLIDGRTMNSPQSNEVNWAALPISEQEIDRVEIIKGPGSALYGANAFSGVINIITKSPREMAGTTVRVSAGSQGTFSGSVTNAGVREKLAYKISGGFFENDDFLDPALVDTIPGLKPTPENFRILKGEARMEYQASDKTQLAGSGGFVAQNNHKLVASTASVNTEKENNFYVFGKFRHKKLAMQAHYNGARTDTIRALGLGTGSFANYDLFRFEAQQAFTIGKRNRLVWGGEYQWQLFDTKGILIPNAITQNLYGFYSQYELQLRSNLRLILVNRVDHHPTVKFQFSPKAGLIYTLSNQQAFRLTVNQAYVNPVFLELFTEFPFPIAPGIVLGIRGNRNLDPRKITAFEIGYQGFIRKKLKINLDVYRYNVKDFISPARIINFLDPNAVSHINFGKVSANGIDFGLLYLIGRGLRWNFAISAVRTSERPVFSENPEENTTNKIPSLNAPRLKLNSALDFETPQGFYGRAAIRFVDDYDWVQEQPFPIPRTILTRIESYVIPDITLGYRAPDGNLRISMTASNLFDKEHQELPRGAFIGRKIIGSLTTHF